MGVSLSTARYLAPASFLYDFVAQQYGINSTPSMKDIHDRNLSFFSPQPFFIAGFFFPQQFFQLAWLVRLWRLDPNKPAEARELDEIVSFVPYYALGNVCIGTWMFFWNAERLKAADAFVIVNTFAQLYYIFARQGRMNRQSWSSILTHVVSKTFAGIGVLDLLHNTSVAWYKDQSPSTLTKVLTGVGFAGLSSVSDWIFGGCLVYDLIGLSVGQAQRGDQGWSTLLGFYAAGSAAIVAARNYLYPPYDSDDEGYKVTAQDEVDDRV